LRDAAVGFERTDQQSYCKSSALQLPHAAGSHVPLCCAALPLQNNPNAFAMTERQKMEGAGAVHLEETRVKMMMAIGQAPPLDDAEMLRHLHEYALEVGWRMFKVAVVEVVVGSHQKY
jgi:hypothetical protein